MSERFLHNKSYVNVDLFQDDMQMYVSLSIDLTNKMGDIRSRNPELWKGKDFDLCDAAEEELAYEQSIQRDDYGRLFKFTEINGIKGIYIIVDGQFMWVNPHELIKAIWSFDERTRMVKHRNVDLNFNRYVVIADYYGENYEFHDQYLKYAFIDCAKQSLLEFCKAVKNGYIEDSWETRFVDRLEKGVEHLSLPVDGWCIYRKEIDVESLSFTLYMDTDNKIRYLVSFKDRSFEDVLYQGVKSLTILRLQLEQLIINSPYKTVINFQTDVPNYPVSLKFSNIQTWDTEESFIKFTLEPSLLGGPILFGYCKLQQIVKAMYLALLDISTSIGTSLYNSVQSSLIENFLFGTPQDELSQYPRQRFVGNNDDMMSDYEAIIRKLI